MKSLLIVLLLATASITLAGVGLSAAPSQESTPSCCGPTDTAKAASVVSTTAAEPNGQPAAPSTRPSATALFEKLKGLAGHWEGKSSEGDTVIEYSITGGGSAVVENMTMHGGMTTVYTLDNDRVIMTHYCGAGNQPRMTSSGLDGTKATFKFLDITGLATPASPHMHDLTLTFNPDGSLNHAWQLYTDAKPAMMVEFHLTQPK